MNGKVLRCQTIFSESMASVAIYKTIWILVATPPNVYWAYSERLGQLEAAPLSLIHSPNPFLLPVTCDYKIMITIMKMIRKNTSHIVLLSCKPTKLHTGEMLYHCGMSPEQQCIVLIMSYVAPGPTTISSRVCDWLLSVRAATTIAMHAWAKIHTQITSSIFTVKSLLL